MPTQNPPRIRDSTQYVTLPGATRHNRGPGITSEKVVAYARVSTAEQADGMSLDAQLRAIRGYAEQRDLFIVAEFIERGASATDDSRPEFQRMIEALLSPTNEARAVIVIHTSRFMRDVELARRYKRELRKHGVKCLQYSRRLRRTRTAS